jgi:hypothetical protein
MNLYSDNHHLTDDQIIALTRSWVEQVVIGLNLCPFAKPVHVKNQINYSLSHARNEDQLANDLKQSLEILLSTSPDVMDTSLLIHPWVLSDFIDYNNFLDIADAVLDEQNLTGIVQIASFHPDYQFAGTSSDDVTNCTNRSPFPMLHLLREESMDKATAALPDASVIVDRNVETMTSLGYEGWHDLQLKLQRTIK